MTDLMEDDKVIEKQKRQLIETQTYEFQFNGQKNEYGSEIQSHVNNYIDELEQHTKRLARLQDDDGDSSNQTEPEISTIEPLQETQREVSPTPQGGAASLF
eukprot:CAMPEP_0117425152 /NCGR_PEP_ID=MMETSP0758-20121206/5462_1 /TAXON_ID=63605 /ORGANISM="Percolomonas cosmopolitus, Strain AE-1 (ATCC 50343)" /LENGTH=100 /DNA_ID=CAMNT_0005209427 /DNA_START=481 /DNA_END=780 /DNA_ORIENTATION=+